MTFARHFNLPSSMPHLDGALRLSGARGLCFHRAVGFMLDVGPPNPPVLVFGRVRAANEEERAALGPDASPTPFIHAWVEWHGLIWAPTLIERMSGLYPVDRAMYLERNGAKELARMTRGEVKRLDRLHGFSAHLKRFAPLKGADSFGAVLLAAAGVKWRDNGLGGVEAVE